MLQLDERLDEARIRGFAENTKFLPQRVRDVFTEILLKEQGPEFYHGMLAGLQYAHQLSDHDAEKQQMYAAAIALVAEHIVDKGWW